ncbi:selenocysteine-specific translation elongation factor [Halalkalibacter wakoensis JCM 9140]|uniref:Selenocysteine-specific elongation factor n=1 Tax=Halalkalibacter wakoensis JCM 9140 TaxID=1236970 RepID=W4PZ96_9BACI|nr:selenocysteine-specific translation elongation factor [Halalkalibacter wakoensis]GAE24414.1 selenocysteine-specific translation elongation factor [Halalkalibacter wakoensis JCM 9140]
MNHYTIGMAGHIDHGKTTLTKALTNVDTDRLKEEKERSISIELGYAPFKINDEMEVSLIDVPGHERFIRQMIAGVAGIDLVMLVVAADEGVMPQTKEHIDILQLLGIDKGIIIVTKMDRVDDEIKEIVELDIREAIEGTFLEQSQLFFVDSLHQIGMDDVKKGIETELSGRQGRDATGAFRLPIDQVFTIHGQGTVVRGTVYEGSVKEGDVLDLLPQRIPVRARQIQVHHQARESGRAGQRVAINVGGVSKNDITRGNTLVATGHYETTQTIDVALTTVEKISFPVKQRGAIKVHIGTAEVYGKIVFFDRNELVEGNEQIVCQLRLDEPVVTRRGDRFIVRRPTPTETIGGGKVIDAHGDKYKFSDETIRMLKEKMVASPSERLKQLILEQKAIALSDASKTLTMTTDDVLKLLESEQQFHLLPSKEITTEKVILSLKEAIQVELERYHHNFPMREGIKKAEMVQTYSYTYPKRLIEWVFDEGSKEGWIIAVGPFAALPNHRPHPPEQWKKRIEQLLLSLKKEGLQVSALNEHLQAQQLPQAIHEEVIYYFHHQHVLYQIDEKYSIHRDSFQHAVKKLRNDTNSNFSLKKAKESTNLSRKYLVPFLEKLDKLGLTVRQEQERKWRDTEVEQWLTNK